MGRLSLGHVPTRWLAVRSLVSNNGLPTVRHLAFSQLLDTHKINVVTRSQVFMGGAGTILLAVSGFTLATFTNPRMCSLLKNHVWEFCLKAQVRWHYPRDGQVLGVLQVLFSLRINAGCYWVLSFVLEDTFTPKDCLDLLDTFVPGKDNDCCVKDCFSCQWYGTEVGTSSLGQRQPWRELLWCSPLRTTRTFPRTSVETPPG